LKGPGETEGRRFEKLLAGELDAIRDGLAAEVPGVDWSPMPLFGRVAALAALYKGFCDATLTAFGVTHSERFVLGVLRSRQAETPSKLARITHQTRAGMTRTLDRLESRGLVERVSHPDDRRKVRMVLTDKGLPLTDAVLRAEIAAQHRMLEDLGEQSSTRISASLDELIGRLVTTIEHTEIETEAIR
jgi:DNA-binding MarR family transcriptional regulator